MKTRTIYNGECQLTFHPGNHRFTIIDRGQKIKPPSVTTVLSVLAKPMLIQWAANCAVEYLRERLLDGQFERDELESLLNDARFAHRSRTTDAASIGTMAHHHIEEFLRLKGLGGDEGFVIPSDLPEQAKNCIAAGIDWIAKNEVQPIAIEELLYSRELNVAGIGDCFARVRGELAYVDWKSKELEYDADGQLVPRLYDENRFQSAAYCKFYEEITGEKVRDRYVVQLGKSCGNFCEHPLLGEQELKEDWAAFVAARGLYSRIMAIKEKIKGN